MTTTETTTNNPSIEEPQKKKPLHDLHAVLEKSRVEGGNYGMAVSVLYKGELIFAEGFGKRNEKDPFTADTLMPIGSLTKAFTATAIGELVAEGKMDWDTTPVNTYLPEFEFKDPVLTSQLTMADLLSHRTNLPDLSVRWINSKERSIDMIKDMRHVDQPSKLTSKLNYSNMMYGVAGDAAARVAGISYEELIKSKVLEPLGLTNTGYTQRALKHFSNYALPYDANTFEDALKGNFIQGELDENPLADGPAGDMYSNVLDMARWGRAILKGGEVDGKQVLNKEKNIGETLTGRTFITGSRRTPDFAPVVAYGLGWGIDAYKGHAVYEHTGGVSAYRSSIAIYPDLDLVVTVLTNFSCGYIIRNLSYYIVDELLGLPKTEDWLFEKIIKGTKRSFEMYDMVTKGPLRDKIENKPHVHALQDYAGEYTNLALGDVSILLQEEDEEDSTTDQHQSQKKQALYFKNSGYHNKLEHHHFETFKVVLRIFGFAMGAGINFQTGPDGKVAAMVLIELSDQDPSGKGKETVFKRKEKKIDTAPETKEE
ncbi:hypothetical protein BGX23_002994 [Mortierella sp. AD031]|nr:hypothetical protein BGX23_002994 [Mortierella sp. AD031]